MFKYPRPPPIFSIKVTSLRSKYEQWPKDQFDMVIGADILYKASAAKHLAGLIPLILKVIILKHF